MVTTFNSNTSNLFKATQNENEAIRYTINWGGDLDTDTVSSDTWTNEDGGLTIAAESNTTTSSTARLSAADPGCYRVNVKAVTAAGDSLERIIELRVGNNNPVALLDYV